MYIADTFNYRIRKVTVSTGIITTLTGTGTSSYSGDNGPATAATVCTPSGIALDSLGNCLSDSYIFLFISHFFLLYLGNVYIGDANNHRIRKVTVSTGIITSIAGSSTSGSYSGDNGPATSATLNAPISVALDTSGTHSPLLF